LHVASSPLWEGGPFCIGSNGRTISFTTVRQLASKLAAGRAGGCNTGTKYL
jgi:hypothetical protein